MIVLSWSKATRDLLKSFSWGIGALRQLFASDDGAISFAACPIPSLRWRGESGANSSRAAGPTPPIKGRFHRRSDEFLESIKKGVETRMSFRRRSDPFPGPRVKPGEGV